MSDVRESLTPPGEERRSDQSPVMKQPAGPNCNARVVRPQRSKVRAGGPFDHLLASTKGHLLAPTRAQASIVCPNQGPVIDVLVPNQSSDAHPLTPKSIS